MRNKTNRIDVDIVVAIDINININIRFSLRTWLIQGRIRIAFQFMLTEVHRSCGSEVLYRLVQGKIGHYGHCFELRG